MKTRTLDVVQSELVPIAAAALELRMSRECVLRRVQRGVIAGRQVDGFWYVSQLAISEALKRRGALPQSAHMDRSA